MFAVNVGPCAWIKAGRFENPPLRSPLLSTPASTGSARLGVLKLLFLLVVALTPAWAVDPATLISQYSHTSWKSSDGPIGSVSAVTQTADGYIWVYSSQGLLRFDGTRFTPWIPPNGQERLRGVMYLLGARDGSLWIGTTRGLFRLKGDELFDYSSQFAGSGVNGMIEDHNGTIWFTRYRISDTKGPLCRIADNLIQCYGRKDGIPARYGLGLAEDSVGNIWFGSNELYRWSRGSSSTFFEDETKHMGQKAVSLITTGPSGSVWAGIDGVGPKLGLRYYSGGKWTSYVVPGFNGANARSEALYMDRNHSLWIGVQSQGLYRIRNGAAQHYGMLEGLTGKSPQYFYEDREGGLWVATEAGLDLFRDKQIVNFASAEGLVATDIGAILALHNGSVWVADSGTLEAINPDGVSRIALGDGLAGQDPQGMFEDHAGRVWIGFDDRILTYEQGRFTEIQQENGNLLGHDGWATGFAEDQDSTVWALIASKSGSGTSHHLLGIRDRRVKERIPLDGLFRRANYLTADPQGGLWISGNNGALARFRGGRFEVFSLANDDVTFAVHNLVADGDAVWAATNRGLYHWKDGRVDVMDLGSGLPCSQFASGISDIHGNFWLYARCGILKISASDIATWLKSPGTKISAKTFDLLDGAMTGGSASGNQPQITKSPDGRIWFMTNGRVQMIDPSRSWTDPNPPPVYVTELIGDHKSYDVRQALNLPPLRGEMEIDYTALSLAIPQRVRFRYKLEGHDTEWQDPGNRRQAFYTDLGPGKYRFQVVAANKDGVWNMRGADLRFRIAPKWYQSIWFRSATAAAFLLLFWGLYQYRRHRNALEFNVRLEERVGERTRIARELHDTLLQSFQGLMLHFQVAHDSLPAHPVEARTTLAHALDEAARAITEGRDAVQGLRSSTVETNDLARAIGSLGEELSGPATSPNRLECVVEVEGTPRDIHPILRDEVYRIAGEALRNAYRHAQARRIVVVISYGEQQFGLRVRDDGKGMAPEVLDEQGRPGHWGLTGMRERAELIGGELEIWSRPESGTQIEVSLPASTAYATPPARRAQRFTTKTGTDL